MNKTDLVNAVAARTGFTKKDTGHAIDAMIGAISLAMKNGDSVTLAGFGTFKVATRAARAGVNPRTREKMDIPARRSLRFHAAKVLRDLVAPREPAAFVYDGTASGIMVLCGQGVTVSDGSLRFRNPEDENRVVFGQLSWTDYVVHVTTALAAGNGYGIYYRADGKAGSCLASRDTVSSLTAVLAGWSYARSRMALSLSPFSPSPCRNQLLLR